MKTAKWIWRKEKAGKDEYLDFIKDFELKNTKSVLLNISCNTDYTVYINGELAGFGQYSDYPYYKVKECIDISNFAKLGKNKLAVCGCFEGGSSTMFEENEAGIIFEITQNNGVICFSDENTLCRLSKDYISHKEEYLTGSIGYRYHYDMSAYDNWKKIDFNSKSFENCCIIDNRYMLACRPVKKEITGNRIKSILHEAGSFIYNGGGNIAQKMQNAILKPQIKTEGNRFYGSGDGIYFIYDLCREEAGILNFKINTKTKTNIYIGYGEHIADGRVRSYLGGHTFVVDYVSKEGWQEFTGTFKRFGARYLQLFAETYEIEIEFVTLKPVYYPVNEKKFLIKNNNLRQQIYDTSVRTLKLCMHDHYEDTPWREQALYALDARNQMLCGYYAFSEKDFARASLKLLGIFKRNDNLLPICFPSRSDLTIPSFSLHYFTAMKEYIDFTEDTTLANELYGRLQAILDVFINRQENCLIPVFSSDKNKWNFYEWAEGLDGALGKEDSYDVDIILNALFSIALQNMILISKKTGKSDYTVYEELYIRINKAINKNFYNAEKGLYKTSCIKNKEHYCELGNALAILCLAADKEQQNKIADILTDKGNTLVKTTLSMDCFKYDALLKVDKDKYREFILSEIDDKYGYMLKCGATSFWETFQGQSAFYNAGSLCHGWSAMPVYYYHLLKV